MKKIARYFPRTIVSKFLVGLAIFLSLSGSVRSQGQGLRVIDVTAKKYEYSISPVHVKVGTKVQLKITATDPDHGFSLDPVPLCPPNTPPPLFFSPPSTFSQLKK